MKTKLLTIIFLSTILLTSATAQLNEEELEEAKQGFNEADIPSFLGSIIGDQTINLEITKDGETQTLGIETENTEVVEVRNDEFEEPTLEAEIEESQIEEIAESEDPIETLNEKLKQDEIEYETHTVGNTARAFIAESLISFGSFFS